MSSCALLFRLSGAHYEAIDKVLYLDPAIKGDFRCFACAASGDGRVGVRNGKPCYEIRAGTRDVREVKRAGTAAQA